jgi:hypothetical protein
MSHTAQKLSSNTPVEAQGESMYSSYSFTTSALDWVSVTPRPRFTPRERTSGTNCTGSWVGPRAGLDTEATGIILLPGIEPRLPGRPVRSQTLYRLSYPGSVVNFTELKLAVSVSLCKFCFQKCNEGIVLLHVALCN